MLADVYFSVPLQVSFPNGVTRSFESVHDTVDFLENEWPLRHGERYKRAREKCRAALYRMTPVLSRARRSWPRAWRPACPFKVFRQRGIGPALLRRRE